MSLHTSRRALLRTVGAATLAGLAGCGSNGATTTTSGGDTTYGIEVENTITNEDFENTPQLDGPRPAVVFLRVNDLDPGSEATYFEKTVEVETGATRTFSGAFTVKEDGPTYAMSAQLEPFVEGGLSDPRNREDGLTFTPFDRPAANPISVVVRSLDLDDRDEMFPSITIHSS